MSKACPTDFRNLSDSLVLLIFLPNSNLKLKVVHDRERPESLIASSFLLKSVDVKGRKVSFDQKETHKSANTIP